MHQIIIKMSYSTLYLSFLGHNVPFGSGARQDHFTGSNFPVNSITLVLKAAIPSGFGIT